MATEIILDDAEVIRAIAVEINRINNDISILNGRKEILELAKAKIMADMATAANAHVQSYIANSKQEAPCFHQHT